MNKVGFHDPQRNLGLIIRESGLTQSMIAEKIGEHGYSVARATINRWANPQKRNRSFSYNPLIMQTLLEVCGENLVTGLRLEDLFIEEHALAAKLRTRKSSGEMLPGVISRATRELSAEKYDDALSGRYVADIPLDFISNQSVRAIFELRNDDSVKFDVRCSFGHDGNSRDEQLPVGKGQMLIWERSAIITVETDLESLMLMTIMIALPSHRAIVDRLEGAITISGSKTRNSPIMSHIVMERLADDDAVSIDEATAGLAPAAEVVGAEPAARRYAVHRTFHGNRSFR